METEALWTLDELVRRVAAALAGGAYPGSPNGRVRDLPDRRVVRWYATIGLVDRPAATRGRTALYGPRHLLQLVAVKRRQAQGRALADIQAELTGATDAMLRRIAGVPAELLGAGPVEAGPVEAAPVEVGPVEAGPARGRFWSEPPARAGAEQATVALTQSEPAASGVHDADTVTILAGVPLGAGALLLLAARPGADDLDAIHAAARPLLDLLAVRGLLDPAPSPVALSPTTRRSRS
jgi:hypothetical protein